MKKILFFLVFLLSISIATAIPPCFDNDGDGFNATDMGCCTQNVNCDCDDSDNSIVPPVAGEIYGAPWITSITFCSGTYQIDGQITINGGTVASCDNTTLTGTNNNWNLIDVWGGSTLQNCEFTNISVPIFGLNNDGITIQNNYFHDIQMNEGILQSTNQQEHYNITVYNNNFENIYLTNDYGIFEFDNISISGISIDGNTFTNTTIVVFGANFASIDIVNNAMINITNEAIYLENVGNPFDHAYIFNNVIYNATTGILLTRESSYNIINNNYIFNSSNGIIIENNSNYNEITKNLIINTTPITYSYLASNQYLNYNGNDFNMDPSQNMTLLVCTDIFSSQSDPTMITDDDTETPPCIDGITNISVSLVDLSALQFGGNATILVNTTFNSCTDSDTWWNDSVGMFPTCYFTCVLYIANGSGNDYILNESCFNATVNVSSGLTYPPYIRYANISHYGLYIDKSTNNSIWNNYFNNTNNAYDSESNYWNTTKTPAPSGNIIGGGYFGGNFYNDYNGTDSNGDGLGETPYLINGTAGSYDYLPYTNINTPIPLGNGTDCLEIHTNHPTWLTGTYLIDPTGNNSFYAYCNMDIADGGWTLISYVPLTQSGYWHKSDEDYNSTTFPYDLNSYKFLEPNTVDSSGLDYEEILFTDDIGTTPEWFIINKSSDFFEHNYVSDCFDGGLIENAPFNISDSSNGTLTELHAYWAQGCPAGAQTVTLETDNNYDFVSFDNTFMNINKHNYAYTRGTYTPTGNDCQNGQTCYAQYYYYSTYGESVAVLDSIADSLGEISTQWLSLIITVIVLIIILTLVLFKFDLYNRF